MTNLKASEQSLFDEFEIKGEWWLPNAVEDKLVGTLYFSKENIKLDLMGSWTKDDSLQSAFETNSVDIILGQSTKNEMFTLMDTMLINRSLSSGGYSTVIYDINSFIVGGHFSKKNEIFFSAATIYPTYLTKWLNRHPFKMENEKDSNQVTVEYIPEKGFEYYIPSIGAKIKEESSLELQNLDFNLRMQMYHSSRLSISSEELRDVEWFLERTNQLVKLVSTLIGGGVYYEKILFKGERNESNDSHGESSSKLQYYSYFRKQRDIRLKEKFSELDIVIDFFEVEKNLEAILNNWYEKYQELEVIHNLYFGFLYNVIHIDTTFLNSVQMLEIYHRTRFKGKIFEEEFFKMEKKKLKGLSQRNLDENFHIRVMQSVSHANDFSLGSRLDEIINTFSIETKESLIGTPEEIKIFIRQLVDTRNFLAHYDENRKPHLIKGIDERYYAIKRLEAIITLLLLKETGLDEETVLHKMKDNVHYSHNLIMAKKILNKTTK